MLKRTPFPVALLTLYIIAFILIPLFQDGMFMDATQYTAVAHNLSYGYGSFWHAEFSMRGVSNYDAFYEQPPLGLFMLSLFYRVLGDSMYVERFFILLCLIANLMLIRAIWRTVFRDDAQFLRFSYLPLLLYVIIPIITWTYDSFMLENLMTVWILASVLCLWKSTQSKHLIYPLLAGVCIFLATFTKGIPGLFPLGVPFLLAVMRMQNWPTAIRNTGILFGVLAIPYIVFFNMPESRHFYEMYLFDRTAYRLESLPTVQHRTYTLVRLAMELIPVAAITAIIIFINRKQATADMHRRRNAVFFLLLGIAGSLPLMLTLIQKGFYLVPAMPFFALGFAMLLTPYLIQPGVLGTQNRFVRYGRIFLITALSVVVIIRATQILKPNRDAELLSDLKTLSPYFEDEWIIYSPNAMWGNWAMQSYLMRYYCRHMNFGFRGPVVIVDTRIKLTETIQPGYARVAAATKRNDLYIRK